MLPAKQTQLLTSIKQKLEQLQQQIAQAEFAAPDEAYFDPHLFAPIPKHQQQTALIQDYLQECFRNYDYLCQEVAANNSAQVNYLSEKLANQMQALRREIATHQQRLQHPTATAQPPETIYEMHARYLSYQRRLQAMHDELTQQLEQTQDYQQQQHCRQQLQQVAQRLLRCNNAIAQLEQHMH